MRTRPALSFAAAQIVSASARGSPGETCSPVKPYSTISANDVLNGGAGDDFLIGGSGADLFQFRSAHRVDIITDFSEKDRLIITQTSMARTSIRMRWVIGCRTWASSCRRGWISFDDRPLKAATTAFGVPYCVRNRPAAQPGRCLHALERDANGAQSIVAARPGTGAPLRQPAKAALKYKEPRAA
ncbi:calcium-binding protein [Paracoccus aminovorans]|uniref:calcium-binding protein n=1 Tax=Paracoccus aminovorans TaxID=34004 RepID=UPI002B262EA4|nr:calcium-binding protein [Paracoccus aminovorans]